MEPVATNTRNSRWGVAPVRNSRGVPVVARITDQDVERIFLPLSRYRYLPVDYLHALGGGSRDYLVNRLGLLSRIPNLYVKRPLEQRANAAANHRPLVYELADKAWRLMEDRGLVRRHARPPTSFVHELMTCLVMASFELGARRPDVRFIGWDEILDSRSLPDATRLSPKPWHIPVTALIAGHRVSAQIVPDGTPFGICRIGAPNAVYFFCPGVEVDYGTEPIDASDFGRSSIAKKFALYLAIVQQGIHRSHFGFPNLYVPFITTTMARIKSMMRLLDRMTEGAGSKAILFKTFSSPLSPTRAEPSGLLLTEDWRRVGHPTFNFLRS